MRILLSGSSGFIGSSLYSHWVKLGHEVVSLKRGDPALSNALTVFWNPDAGSFLQAPFEGFDAVVHLAGESIMGRWTRHKKHRMLFSRTVGTSLLSRILAQAIQPPKIVLSASAIGYYGDRGEELLTETSLPGQGFLASVCCEWEKATRAIQERGSRVVNTRFAPVIGNGGILKSMLFPFKLGLGGKLGSGMQWMSWVALNDLIRGLDFCLQNEAVKGAVNIASPNPVRQHEFSSTLAKVLHRPAFFHQPSWLLRLIFGQMADEVLLSSEKVSPEKLLAEGFTFEVPRLQQAFLRALL